MLIQRLRSTSLSAITSLSSQAETVMSIRAVRKLITAKPTLEGAGVHLRRAFGFGETSDFDPFLLLDDFRNDIPEDYLAGFPWHPHRGIETITYVLAGTVEHGDSMGNRGAIGAGDVQWMTAGSGIIHQEMPKGDPAGRMHGFQLWANLPASLKMTAPRYQEVKARRHPGDHRRRRDAGARRLRQFLGEERAGRRHRGRPIYLDVSVPPGQRKTLPVETTPPRVRVRLRRGGEVLQRVRTRSRCRPRESDGWTPRLRRRRTTARWCSSTAATRSRCRRARMGFGSCWCPDKPLQEPVAWYGPIVMNTQAELRQAFEELDQGTFLKQR